MLTGQRGRASRISLQSLALVAVISLAAAGCGSSSKTGQSSGPSSSAPPKANTAALGTPNKATGSTVSVGLISDGGSGAIGTAPLVEAGAKMAVSYMNDYQGGLGGHVLKLEICENQETPAGGQNCANQMVQDKVVAVVVPFTGEGAAEVPTVTAAGIPWIGLSGASTQELTTAGAFALTGGFPATLGAYALHAKEKGFKKVAMLVSNVPAAIQGAQALGSLVFKNAGVGFKVIPVAPGAADQTPELQSAVSYGADAIGIVGDVTLCSSFLKGYQTLALTQPKYVIGPCLDKSIFSALGSELNGSYLGTTAAASSEEKAQYAAITQKYAPSIDPDPTVSSNQSSGAITLLSLGSIMKGYTGEVTAATVLSRTKSLKNVALPLSGGLVFSCDGTAIPLLKSVCSSEIKVGVVNGKGVISDLKAYNSTPLFHG